MNNLVLERESVHLEPLQHGSPAIEQDFPFEQSLGGGKRAVQPARSL